MELEDHVAVVDDFAVREVADPVVGQIRSDQDELAGAEPADVVADDGYSDPVLDEVDLVLGVVVPSAVRAGVVMPVPPRRGAGHRRYKLACGRPADEPTRPRDRAGWSILAAYLILFGLIVREKRTHLRKKVSESAFRPLEANVCRTYAFGPAGSPKPP